MVVNGKPIIVHLRLKIVNDLIKGLQHGHLLQRNGNIAIWRGVDG